MTRPLRRIHLGMFLVLALVLPALLVIAIAGRPSPTTSSVRPAPAAHP
jgi:hypothetical protein